MEQLDQVSQGSGFSVIISSSSWVPVVMEVDRELRSSVEQNPNPNANSQPAM